MAKKKKTTTKAKEVCNSETEVVRLEGLIAQAVTNMSSNVSGLADIVADTNERIDNIIENHEKCKSLKGL